MFHFYADESGTDDRSTAAVLGGILIQQDRFYWLDVEWEKALKRHGVEGPIHMKEFGPGLRLDMLHSKKRALLKDLVGIINEHKNATLSATLIPEEHKKYIGMICEEKDRSVYGDCFIHLCVFMSKLAEVKNYRDKVPFVMDEDNPHKHFVLSARDVIRDKFQSQNRLRSIGGLSFESDSDVRILQAADMISWASRRRLAGLKFNNGSEPVENIFLGEHYETHLDPEVMQIIVAECESRMRANEASA